MACVRVAKITRTLSVLFHDNTGSAATVTFTLACSHHLPSMASCPSVAHTVRQPACCCRARWQQRRRRVGRRAEKGGYFGGTSEHLVVGPMKAKICTQSLEISGLLDHSESNSIHSSPQTKARPAAI